MYYTRRALWPLFIGMWMFASGLSYAQAVLPSLESLPKALAAASQRGQPLVVMVSLDGCPYCKMVRESHLAPMRVREGLAVVQVDMRNKSLVVDSNGQTLTQDALVRRWGVTVAPTVLFIGPDGREIAERLVGGYIPDFYGAYLGDRLHSARLALQLPAKKTP